MITGLASSSFKHLKAKQTLKTSVKLLYAGSWQYYDVSRNKTHQVEIAANLDLSIDQRPITTQVELVDEHNLIYLDNFGYHITFVANESRPIKMLDEADDQAYIINPLK